jgi:hypothetical protein
MRACPLICLTRRESLSVRAEAMKEYPVGLGPPVGRPKNHRAAAVCKTLNCAHDFSQCIFHRTAACPGCRLGLWADGGGGTATQPPHGPTDPAGRVVDARGDAGSGPGWNAGALWLCTGAFHHRLAGADGLCGREPRHPSVESTLGPVWTGRGCGTAGAAVSGRAAESRGISLASASLGAGHRVLWPFCCGGWSTQGS